MAARRREAKVDPAPAAREELGPTPPEILQFESGVVPGLGEHGKGVPIGDHTEVGRTYTQQSTFISHWLRDTRVLKTFILCSAQLVL